MHVGVTIKHAQHLIDLHLKQNVMPSARNAPVQISHADFRKIGHDLVDRIADFLDTIDKRDVTRDESPRRLQTILGNKPWSDKGQPADELIARACQLLFEHSLFNGHPKFSGYITSSPAPIGVLADLLAAAVNPNVGAQILSPMATEFEKQTVQWLSDMIGAPGIYSGLLVSGGNVANLTAFFAAKNAKVPSELKQSGLAASGTKFTVYCSKATHTWVEKAAVLSGLGLSSLRWIACDDDNRMDINELERTIAVDVKSSCQPIIVIGTAGDVSTGVVDDLRSIARVCKKFDLWFHVDGAYGAPAVIVPSQAQSFDGLLEADSIALDPHKWLYSPLEAGCTLVKDARHLTNTYSSHPEYYNFDGDGDGSTLNFYEYGMQNSRGFRSLKVWLILQHAGREGFTKMISDDIDLSASLFAKANAHPELEAVSNHLSITNFRYVPLKLETGGAEKEAYLNKLNEALLNRIQRGGKVFMSNSMVKGRYCLRSCIVNFRTTEKDIAEIIEIVVEEGRAVDSEIG
jgi:glutamate/tyrosine decarboxylase-like PLP-dependent enzyme